MEIYREGEEGDSLGIGCTIHSFYWSYDIAVPPKKEDYEPVAFCKVDNICLTRVHYRGIVLWQDFTLQNNKPVVYFRNGSSYASALQFPANYIC